MVGKLGGFIWGIMLFSALYGAFVAGLGAVLFVAVNATHIFCSAPDWESTFVGTVVGLVFGFSALPIYIIYQRSKETGHG